MQTFMISDFLLAARVLERAGIALARELRVHIPFEFIIQNHAANLATLRSNCGGFGLVHPIDCGVVRNFSGLDEACVNRLRLR
jgi:hypothetical protein